MQVVSRPTDVIAVVFAFAAFAVVLVSGFVAGRSATETLLMSLIAMFIARIAGQVFGAAAEIAVREHTDRHKQQNPIPDASEFMQVVEPESSPAGAR